MQIRSARDSLKATGRQVVVTRKQSATNLDRHAGNVDMIIARCQKCWSNFPIVLLGGRRGLILPRIACLVADKSPSFRSLLYQKDRVRFI
jgi:hypothetical protein